MKSYENSKGTLALMITIFVITYCFSGGWFLFVNNELKQVQRIKAEISSELNQNYSMISTQKAVDDLKNKEFILDQSFIKESDIIVFMRQLENIGTKTQTPLIIEGVNLKKDPKLGNTLEMLLKTTGNFANTQDFLNIIENIPYHSKINSIRLDRVNNVQGSSVWNMNISLTILAE
ncbi:MAG TPA: hypothetical protein PKA60_02450 [Candidatus Paceibacterota bacterium]|nr:hypothetical protein [Candidatus Paceibacterota bacterium]